MAPWWLRSATDDAPVDASDVIDAIDTDDEPTEDDETADDDAPPSRGRRRSRRRRRGKSSGEQPAAERGGTKKEEARDEPKPAEPAEDSKPAKKAERAEAERPRKRRRRRGGRSDDAAAKPAPSQPAAEPRALAPEPAPAPSPQPALVSPPASDLAESLGAGVVYIPERAQDERERKIAMFFDFENIALGVRDTKDMTFDVGLVLARLLEKGKIIVKRAYADWQRYAEFKRPLHEAAIEMIDIPKKRYSGKNSADIKMVVDAMDLCYAKEHLDTFVLVSGDSDFSPLVSKLKENDKYVIGLGMKSATSQLLVDNCDEFIYYEDVWRDAQHAPKVGHVDTKTSEAFQLLAEAMQALVREDKEVLWGSMIKQTMKRKRPSFNEGYYGYDTFSELLEDAEQKGVIRLRRDQRSGGYIVTGFASRPSKRG